MTDSTVLLPNAPTEDQQQITRLGQREQLQVRNRPKNEMERCVGVQVQKRERERKMTNTFTLKGETTEQDSKFISE